jgi:phthiocerol/phenolphthiocerol synthesis type-I polyketide synthase E
VRWLSANWDGWLLEEGGRLSAGFETSLDRYAMAPSESVEALRRIVTRAAVPQVVVSTGEIESRRSSLSRGTEVAGGQEAVLASAAVRPALGTAFEPPDDGVEAVVAQVWGELLGLQEVGVHDNFFDLGGNSLIGLRVIAELKKRLGVEIPVRKLFEGPTVRAFARSLEEDGASRPSFDDSQQRGERRRVRRRREHDSEELSGVGESTRQERSLVT